MTRQQAVQAVLALVFLSVALRWVPDEDPTDPLGLGTPWETVAFDRDLASVQDDLPALRARRIAGGGDEGGRSAASVDNQPSNQRRWTRLITKADRLLEEHGGAPGTPSERPRVQLRGFDRNDAWVMTYLLYPLRTFGIWYEQGGRDDDALDPSAVAEFTERKLLISELPPEQAAEALQRLQDRRTPRRQ